MIFSEFGVGQNIKFLTLCHGINLSLILHTHIQVKMLPKSYVPYYTYIKIVQFKLNFEILSDSYAINAMAMYGTQHRSLPYQESEVK